MMAKRCSWTLVFFIVVGAVAAVENYMDYGTDESSSNDNTDKLRELYKMIVQRSVDEDGLRGFAEHLQPRAAERSPSLRLRFGRSYAKYPRSPSLRLRFGRSYSSPVGLLSRLNDGVPSATAFEEN